MATLADLQYRIAGVRAKERKLVTAEGLCRGIVALVGVVLVYFLLDWIFDLPYGARLAGVAAGLGLIGYVVFRYLILPLLRIQDDDEIALRVEARNPDLRGRLISTLQLVRTQQAGVYAGSPDLIAALEQETLRMADPLDFSQIISTETLVRMGVAAGIILVIKFALVARFPSYFAALAERLVHPQAQFPTKTHIKEIKTPPYVARGDDLPVEVTLDASGEIPRVSGTLSFQGKGHDSIPVELALAGGTVFKGSLAKALEDVDLTVYIGDARSLPQHIRVLAKPEIDTAASGEAIRYTQPAYTGEVHPPAQKFGPLSALMGSTAEIQFASTKPLVSARLERSDGKNFELQKRGVDGRSWGLAGFPIDKSGTFHISMLDTDSLKNSQPPVEYPIEARPDLPPTIKLVRPIKDATVTPNAKPTLVFNARDDYGIRAIWLVYRLQSDTQSDSNGDLTRVEIKTEHLRDINNASLSWDLSALNVQVGDQLVFWLECDDDCQLNDYAPARKKREGDADPADQAQGPVYPRSQDIKFSVISRQDKAAELQAEVDRLVQQIERSEKNQEELKGRVRELLELIQKLKAGN